MTEKELLAINLGEIVWSGSFEILRVFNGWVYLFYDEKTDTITSSVFVPEKLNCNTRFINELTLKQVGDIKI